jgi:hypothetical protein
MMKSKDDGIKLDEAIMEEMLNIITNKTGFQEMCAKDMDCIHLADYMTLTWSNANTVICRRSTTISFSVSAMLLPFSSV